ncbi:MAG: transcription antitermination factor NusB [Rhodospirillaceae bacterium]
MMGMPLAKADDFLRAKRSSTRLAAVQSLYQVATTGSDYTRVMKDFLAGHLGGVAIEEDPDTELETPVILGELDHEMYTSLVSEACARKDEFDGIIEASLSTDWPQARLELIVRSILRVAVAELFGTQEIPVRVTISEYVDITHAFYVGSEPKMVNAVLDRIVRTVRGPENAIS